MDFEKPFKIKITSVSFCSTIKSKETWIHIWIILKTESQFVENNAQAAWGCYQYHEILPM